MLWDIFKKRLFDNKNKIILLKKKEKMEKWN